jgi:hypothetical protein
MLACSAFLAAATAWVCPPRAEAQIQIENLAGPASGSATLTAVAVTSVQDGTMTSTQFGTTTGITETVTIGIRTNSGSFASIELEYPGPTTAFASTPPTLLGASMLDPVVAGLFEQVAKAKMSDSAGSLWGSLTFTNLYFLTVSGHTYYRVTYQTEMTLDRAKIVDIAKASSMNTRGGTVHVTVFGGGKRTVEGLTVSAYGKVTLQRDDSGTPYQFDCYPLSAELYYPMTGMNFGAINPGPQTGMYDVNKFYGDALQGQMMFYTSPFAPLKINDTRLIYRGCTWASSF